MSGNDDTLEPVTLSEENLPKTNDEGEKAPPAAASTDEQVADPWAIDETAAGTTAAAGTTTDETLEDGEPPVDKTEALSKLKMSSQRLASNLDQKLGISNAFGFMGTQVKQLDQQTHVSETVKNAAGGIGSWFSSVDEKFKLSQKGKDIGSSISNIVPTQEISAGIQQSTRALQTFDNNHGITKTAASGLADGADFLTNSIGPSKDEGDADVVMAADADGAAAAAAPAAPVVDEVDAVDSDGLPSSFQK